MKINPLRFPPAAPNDQSGVALVFVLFAVVIVTGLMVAFLSAISMERQTSSANARSIEARMMADSAVSLVMGQIRQASEDPQLIWTSQPGLLRTFKAGGAPGDVFKLYSAGTLTESAASYDPAKDTPTDWQDRPAEYVNINRPVRRETGSGNKDFYPILDPRGAGNSSVPGQPQMIEGFTVDANGVKMPVAWMYLLEDGQITNFEGISKENPPVARIAFWTDDETSKLNVNTASEGFFWDMPRASGSNQEWHFSISQPTQGEYQGYPGHPATTSLSPVFWSYFKNKNPALERWSTIQTSAGGLPTFPEVLYAMLPRTSPGGSKGGTVSIRNLDTPLPPKSQRLFSSVDEMAFLASEVNGVRDSNPYIDRDTLEQSRFFLTTHSRAPELTLGGFPRITAWPIHSQQSDLYRTPFDRLIAFASTLNGHPYYFTRSDANSPTVDFQGRNVELYEYLQRLTQMPVPGFGGSFADKYGADRDQTLTQIFDYIRCINLQDNSTSDPNFKPFTPRGKVDTTTPADVKLLPNPGSGQVVPIIPPAGGPGGGTKGFGRFHTLNRAILVISSAEEDTATQESKLQAAVLFETFDPSMAPAAYGPNYTVAVTTLQPFTIESDGSGSAKKGTVNFSGSTPAKAPTGLSGGSDRGGYNGFTTLTAIQDRKNNNTALPKTQLGGAFPYPFVTAPFEVSWNSVDAAGDNNSDISVKGGELQVEIRGPDGTVLQTLRMKFADFTTKMPRPQWPNSGNFTDTLHQGTNYRLFDHRIPLSPNDILLDDNPRKRWHFVGHWISEADVARSLEATGNGISGDLRLIAASTNPDLFAPVEGYATTDQRAYSAMATINPERQFQQGFVEKSAGYNNKRFGRLVENALSEERYRGASFIPAGINGVRHVGGGPGDWDTGMGSLANGPYINRSDDGDIGFKGSRVPYHPTLPHGLPPGQTFSSPSRQFPSAVEFGSLPTGVKRIQPWQTLLFSANPASIFGPNATPHPGATDPKDHLWLDLFQVPVVEPYAISEPFSTAGKVNMNYQIMPFTGIVRKTALYGILQAVKLTAINDRLEAKYLATDVLNWRNLSMSQLPAPNATPLFRYDIDIPATLANGFDPVFASPDRVFKSASQIADVPLIPKPKGGNPVPFTTLKQFWEANKLTGDNLRENPYSRIYPRLTTRSNTYTVHVWAEALQKIPSTPSDTWVEGRDKVVGQFRGSFLIERYLNPSDPIPDYATDSAAENLNRFYHFRVVNALRFMP